MSAPLTVRDVRPGARRYCLRRARNTKLFGAPMRVGGTVRLAGHQTITVHFDHGARRRLPVARISDLRLVACDEGSTKESPCRPS